MNKIKELIDNADAIVIGAGSGLSTSFGLDYGFKDFDKKFPELVKKYNFTDFYSSSFYNFKTEEERWSYWSKHISYCYGKDPLNYYHKLYDIFKNKNYFVITTNVDGGFLTGGFPKDKVFEVQGSLSKIQCSMSCHNKLYDDLELVDKMLKSDKDCKIPRELIPYCPRCHEKMEVNLRKDNFFVEDDNWNIQNNRYNKFINDNINKNIVLIELGVGFNTPGIIRFPFEELAFKHNNIYLIRVNDKYTELAYELNNTATLIKDDCKNFVDSLSEE